MKFLVTVDGAAGVGKGTLCRRLAEHWKFDYIDSGRSYRAVAALILEHGGDAVEAATALLAHDLERTDLYSPAVEEKSSEFAKIPEVRIAINCAILKMIDKAQLGTVLDGRAGAYEFAQAQIKLFLSASAAVRADRLCKRLREQGQSPDYQQVFRDLVARDDRDRQRSISPLQKHPDAIEIDTTDLNADAVFTRTLIATSHLMPAVRV